MKNIDLEGSPTDGNLQISRKKRAPIYTNVPAVLPEKNAKYNILRNQSLAVAAIHNSREGARPQRHTSSLPPIALHTVDSQRNLQHNLLMAAHDRCFSSSSNNSLERETAPHLKSQPQHYYGGVDVETTNYASQRIEILKQETKLPPIYGKATNDAPAKRP